MKRLCLLLAALLGFSLVTGCAREEAPETLVAVTRPAEAAHVETLPAASLSLCDTEGHPLAAKYFDMEYFVSTCTRCGMEWREPMDDDTALHWFTGTWHQGPTFYADGRMEYRYMDHTAEGTWVCNGLSQSEYGKPMIHCTVYLDDLTIQGYVYGDCPTTLSMADKELYFQYIGEKE